MDDVDPQAERTPEETVHALERWRGGERAGLDEICRRYQPGLELFLGLYHRRLPAPLRARIEVADVIQETWVQASAGVAGFRYRGPDSFRRWIFEVALHALHRQIEYWRAQRRDPARELAGAATPVREETGDPLHAVVSPATGPATNVLRADERAKLLAILEQLPRRERLIVLLAKFFDEPWSEVATAVRAVNGESVRREFHVRILPKIQRMRRAAGATAR